MVGGVQGLRLGRAPLAQVDAEHDKGPAGEELGLPVLKRLEPELGPEQLAARGHARGAVGGLLGVEGVGAGSEVISGHAP